MGVRTVFYVKGDNMFLFPDYEEPLPSLLFYEDNKRGEALKEVVELALEDLRILYKGGCPWDGDDQLEQQIKDARSLTLTPLLKDCLDAHPTATFRDEWKDYERFKAEFFEHLERHLLRARRKRK